MLTRLSRQQQDRQSSQGVQRPQPPAQHPGLYTALWHVTPIPSQTALLLPGLAPCQVNTTGVSSLCSHCQGTHHHGQASPGGQPRGHRCTKAGPAPQDGPCGSSVVPLATVPCCKHPPHHIPYKLGTCTMAKPHSPSRGDSSGQSQHPEHLDPLLQAAGCALGSHQHPV